MRPTARILLSMTAAIVWLGVAPMPAEAHSVSGVSATNFRTDLRSVTPAVAGLEVDVVEAGSRLQVMNRSGREMVVLGYKDEPYLRIGPDGVFQNRLSPATYINRSRKGENPPESAQQANKNETDWEKVSSDTVGRWHDHRIHWMSPTNPPAVQANPGRRHVVTSEWVVTIMDGTQAISVKGDLVWEPGPSPLPWYGLTVGLLVLVVVLSRRQGWPSWLAVVTAVVVAVDVFHAVGLGLANAGGLGERVMKSVSQSPLAVVGWGAGALAVVWLWRRRLEAGLMAAALAGLIVALLGGASDVGALAHSVVPFAFGAGLARLAVAASMGIGFGLSAGAALRLARVTGPANTQGNGDVGSGLCAEASSTRPNGTPRRGSARIDLGR